MADPTDPEFRAIMNALADGLDEIFNGPKLPGRPRARDVGFVLLTFDFGQTDGGRVNYMSNGERADMIAAMREWLGRVEGRVAETPSTPQ